MAKNHENFAEDQELNPSAYAEQFSGPDATVAQAPEELLRRARMILSTELGKDPLLRNEMRARFKRDAEISVSPTDRGIQKIDEHHPYYVSICRANFYFWYSNLCIRYSNTSITSGYLTLWKPLNSLIS